MVEHDNPTQEYYTMFLTEHFIDNKWVKGRAYYRSLHPSIVQNLSSDWRFKEIPGKRKEAIYLGTKLGEFPAEYPLDTILSTYSIYNISQC